MLVVDYVAAVTSNQ